ncbi:MAG: hypothetical protein IKO41_18445 [Lachnospiraceae bacterium]|nr:hypothetical protein [Lachnospiraceae bacterium]
MTVPLGFAISATAYLLQKYSDIASLDSIVKSTCIARTSSIRHFRASTILGDKTFPKIQVDIPNELELQNEIDDINKIYLQLKNIDIIVTEAIANVKNLLGFKSKKISYIKTIMLTHKFIANMTLNNFKYKEFLSAFICLQCGEVYTKGIAGIDNCIFCGAGFNMIERIYNII